MIGYNGGYGIYLREEAFDITISNNEIRNNNIANNATDDGIGFNDHAGRVTISGNLIVDNGASGVDCNGALRSVNIDNNTITGNGISTAVGAENSGIRGWGFSKSITHNIIL